MGRCWLLRLSATPYVQLHGHSIPLRTLTSTWLYPLVTFLTDLAILLILAVYFPSQVLRCRRVGAVGREGRQRVAEVYGSVGRMTCHLWERAQAINCATSCVPRECPAMVRLG